MGISKKQSTNVRLNLPASSRCGKGKFIEVIFETPALHWHSQRYKVFRDAHLLFKDGLGALMYATGQG